jgi:hypothetical protein
MQKAKKIRHMVIPDTQVKPGDSIEHLRWAGMYAAKMKPDVIVHIGDHWDLPSLSSYDVGCKSYEGRRYRHDIEAGITGMEAFCEPIEEERARLVRNKEKQWNPRKAFTLGNHCHRIIRAINKDPKLEGLIGLDDLELVRMGWEVVPFLDTITIDGICYSHYHTSGTMGRPVSSARAMLNKKMMSCVMGHVQDRDIAYGRRADGSSVTGLFAGIFYQHDEDYLGAQGNRSWRGIWIFNDVVNGAFDELPISLSYLRDTYGKDDANAA